MTHRGSELPGLNRKQSLMPSYTDASLSVVSEEGKSLGISYKTIDARTARED